MAETAAKTTAEAADDTGRSATIPAALAESLGFLTRAVHLQERDHIRSGGSAALPFATYSALAVIAANPGIRQRTLADLLQVQESNMANLTRKLVDEGYVERRKTGTKRGLGLSLTPEGARVLADARPVMHALDRDFAAALPPADYADLVSLLTRVMLSRLGNR